ncbi:iron ABC transporter permease [Glaciihabitans sp. dw_435]|uniref:FecCD family ABC transporter permease n=1 Tax=Glaciihabitans sp. dw_435 TaxID=2720081 RepID=UPI0027DEA1D1|nr:iron ABC transporter permease [Glaciihabitans sp. dw_435]
MIAPAVTSARLGSRRTAVRLGPVSFRWRPRTFAVLIVATVVAVVLAVTSLGVGDFSMGFLRVIEVLGGGGTSTEHLIIYNLRLPRIALAILVGASLAISGALVQTTARNSLASPDLLGVTSGAGAGAVAVIVLGGAGTTASGILALVGTSTAALIGGFVAAGLVAALLRLSGGGGLRPLLIGIGVSAFFGGLTSWMLVQAKIDDAAKANAWLTGSLGGRGWTDVATVGVTLVASIIVLVPLSARLPTIELGYDLARSLGVRVPAATTGLLAIAVVLAAIASSVVGPIGFIALVAPHLARLACAAPRPPLAASALIGTVLLLGSDFVARTAFAPILLPTGAITSLVGAPFLVWLLVRSRKDGLR